jgi:hypothetical protein
MHRLQLFSAHRFRHPFPCRRKCKRKCRRKRKFKASPCLFHAANPGKWTRTPCHRSHRNSNNECNSSRVMRALRSRTRHRNPGHPKCSANNKPRFANTLVPNNSSNAKSSNNSINNSSNKPKPKSSKPSNRKNRMAKASREKSYKSWSLSAVVTQFRKPIKKRQSWRFFI